MPKQKLAKELRKRIVRKFEKRQVHTSFIDSNWSAYVADMSIMHKGRSKDATGIDTLQSAGMVDTTFVRQNVFYREHWLSQFFRFCLNI